MLLAALVLALLLAAACGDRTPLAIKASVANFYAAVANNDQASIADNLATAASPRFRMNVMHAAAGAPLDSRVLRSLEIARVDTPVIHGNQAKVHIVFLDGVSDEVTLVREGLRWKVLTSGRLA